MGANLERKWTYQVLAATAVAVTMSMSVQVQLLQRGGRTAWLVEMIECHLWQG